LIANTSARELIAGDRVRIVAIKKMGSAKLLNGLTGEVVEPHAFARGWYKIRLDPNDITPHKDWSVPGDRLVRCDDGEV
jgi:hypothetical protein